MSDYFESEAVNISTLKWMAKSPAHYLEAHNGLLGSTDYEAITGVS
jgi:hypothetical protein